MNDKSNAEIIVSIKHKTLVGIIHSMNNYIESLEDQLCWQKYPQSKPEPNKFCLVLARPYDGILTPYVAKFSLEANGFSVTQVEYWRPIGQLPEDESWISHRQMMSNDQ